DLRTFQLKKIAEANKVIVLKRLLFIIYFKSVKRFFLSGAKFAPSINISVWPARKIITELKKSSGSAGVPSSPTSAGRPETAHPTTRIKKRDCTRGLHQL
ncbi:MAG: hypothetical protein M1438_03825, partial [Deltaproteobacteria bacterium]|nr:hypothetical protein [Deltaproteobacteria bacterium]